jgi:hypothetical protein
VADLRRFKLAHPLRTVDAEQLGLEHRTYAVGETVTLPYGYAMRLVGAGFVEGAEPGNQASVEASLKRVAQPGKPAPVDAEPANPAAKGKPGPKSE